MALLPEADLSTTKKKGNAMRMRFFALAMSLMVAPALGQTTLRGTPDQA